MILEESFELLNRLKYFGNLDNVTNYLGDKDYFC